MANLELTQRGHEVVIGGVDEVIAKPYRIADLRRVAARVAGGLDKE